MEIDANLKIDDDYVQGVGSHKLLAATEMERLLDSYVSTLKDMRSLALIEGDVANALSAYIECVALINNEILTLSYKFDKLCESFLTDVTTVENYQF